MADTYIIAGAGIAGLSAAEAVRESDPNAEILMFSDDTRLPYSRPMLTKSPFAAFDPKNWTLHGREWFEEKKIDLRLGERLTGGDAEKHFVKSESGALCRYDRLILCTGAYNFVPPIAGKERENVFTVHEADDVYAIKRVCARARRAVVIGGGVIGIEAAFELLRYGMELTVLEAMPYFMTRQLDEEISRRIMAELRENCGIEAVVGAKIREIEGEGETGSVRAVSLEDGRTFPCELVVMATGLRAKTGLAEALGLEIGRAVKIDESCRTSAEDVFAAGDCAEYMGANYILWTQGMLQGRVAGLNAAGRRAFFGTIDSTLLINSPWISLCAIGDMGKDPDAKYEVKYLKSPGPEERYFVNPRQGAFFEKQYFKNGRLVGTNILGNLANMQARKAEILGYTGVLEEENGRAGGEEA